MELFNYISNVAQQIVEGKKNFMQVEREVFQMMKASGALVMETILAEADQRIYERTDRPWKSEGFREMGLLTLFGEIRYRRRLYRDEGGWRYPLDEKLGIGEKQTISPTLEQAAAYVATQNSYRESAKILAQVGISMSHQRVHQAVQEMGEAIEKRFAEGAKGEGTREAQIVVVESDGTHVALQGEDRKRAKSLEMKTGCIYEGWEAADPQGERYRLKHPRVLATAGSSEEYWRRVDQYLRSTYNLEGVGLIVFGSDGAPWGKQGAELYAGSVHQIDRFHFQRWIRRVFGYHEQGMADTIEALVEADERQGFGALMEELRQKHPDKRKEIGKLQRLIEQNWESLQDYRNKVAQLPAVARRVGNVENAVDNLVADRMKKRGMSWTVKGANHLVQVKAAVRNGEWDEVCRWIAEQGARLEAVRTEPESNRRRGRIARGARRQQEVGEWCQAHMPGREGSEAWLRELAKGLQWVTHLAI